ncbi:CLUMA_CG021564, isoform A [Clunio marinus]|uniref:CLUMA_CG021564, isoform A n=1 Tax=Clunio marinus TaxID=568069 RepID=A0A1J1J8S8_9DIPT|nr:CLUMA_CG021564, isoform A [Clunio marinus]
MLLYFKALCLWLKEIKMKRSNALIRFRKTRVEREFSKTCLMLNIDAHNFLMPYQKMVHANEMINFYRLLAFLFCQLNSTEGYKVETSIETYSTKKQQNILCWGNKLKMSVTNWLTFLSSYVVRKMAEHWEKDVVQGIVDPSKLLNNFYLPMLVN